MHGPGEPRSCRLTGRVDHQIKLTCPSPVVSIATLSTLPSPVVSRAYTCAENFVGDASAGMTTYTHDPHAPEAFPGWLRSVGRAMKRPPRRPVSIEAVRVEDARLCQRLRVTPESLGGILPKEKDQMWNQKTCEPRNTATYQVAVQDTCDFSALDLRVLKPVLYLGGKTI